MKIQSVIDAGGALRPAAGHWEVTTPRDLPRGRVFRTLLRFRFDTHGLADAIAIDPAGTTLEASFAPYEVDVQPAGPLHATLTAGGTSSTVVVELDAPRQVRSAKLAAAVTLDSSSTLRLHRLDQGVQSVNATLTAAVDTTSRSATFAGDFTDRRFALVLQPQSLSAANVAELHVRSFPAGPRLGLAQPGQEDGAAFFWRAAGEIGKAPGTAAQGVVHGGAALADALQRHVDALPAPLPPTLDVALVLESDAPCALDVTGLEVAYRFVTASFRGPLLHVSDLASPVDLLRTLHALADPVSRYLHGRFGTPLQHRIEAGDPPTDDLQERLVAELNDAIAGPSLYDVSRFAGVTLTEETTTLIAADPAGLDLQRLNRLLLEQAFPGSFAASADKRILRFAGDREVRADVLVQLPAGAAVASGSVSCVESFGTARADGANGTGGPAPAAKAGVHVGVDKWLAASTAASDPVAAAGVALAFLPLTSKTELGVELQEDWHGQPSGRKLASGSITLAEAGRADWSTLLFADTVVLQPQQYWLVVKAASGEAVWLGEAAAGELRVLARADAKASWSGESVFPGRALLHRLIVRGPAGRGAAQPAATLTVGEGPEPLLVDEQGDRKTYDLSLSLKVALLGRNSAPAIPVALSFGAGLPGLVTVYPPRIEYELGT